jgi:hypothetical protein
VFPVSFFFLFQKMNHARLPVLAEILWMPAPFTYICLAVIFFAVIFHFFVKTPSYIDFWKHLDISQLPCQGESSEAKGKDGYPAPQTQRTAP